MKFLFLLFTYSLAFKLHTKRTHGPQEEKFGELKTLNFFKSFYVTNLSLITLTLIESYFDDSQMGYVWLNALAESDPDYVEMMNDVFDPHDK